MLRYLSAVWDPANSTATSATQLARTRLRQTGSAWEYVVDHAGLFVAYVPDALDTDSALPLDNDHGVILGTLFEASPDYRPAVRVRALTPRTTERLLESGGRSVIDSHWGSYVLFLQDQLRATAYVLRGPMSALACFRSVFQGVHFFFSEVDDFATLELAHLSINWDCIRAQAVVGDYLSQETAINEISTLVSGDCIHLRSGRANRRVYWNPVALQPSDAVDDLEEAAVLLGNATRYCTNAWASLHETVLVSLSGGLDSSIVFSSIAKDKTRRRTIGVNYHSRHSGDERRFARSMAQNVPAELIEVERNPAMDLRTFLTCTRTANPVLSFTAYMTHPFFARLARSVGATAVFDGELGDDVFGHSFGTEVVTDALWRHGFGQKALRVAIDYAKLERVSVWNALREGLKGYKRSDTSPWSVYNYMVRLDVNSERRLASAAALDCYTDMHTRFIHPWLIPDPDTPPARFQLIVGLTISTSTWSHSAFVDSHESSLFRSPLASQPLVEAFVRIPSHLHIANGQSAAVARLAFKSDLSPLVLGRGQGTGSPDLWIADIVSRNRGFLSDTLLGGVLVERGILDPSKLTAVLSEEINSSRAYAADLLVQLYIESWLRRWAASPLHAIA